MQHITCSLCQNTDVPRNDSVTIDGVIVCKVCVDTKITDADVKGRAVERGIDPTVCSYCEKDFGDAPLGLLAQYPVCDACAQTIERKAFPVWVKAFMIGVLVLVVFSFVWNWRFVTAYHSIASATHALEVEDFREASAQFENVYANMPEVHDFHAMAQLYEGVDLIKADRSVEALALLNACRETVPVELNVDFLITQAEIGAGFDTKDYNMFLRATKSYLEYDTTVAMSWAAVASAYACLYATNKSDSIRTSYDRYRARAIALNDTSKVFSDYLVRLDHRLNTGEILSAAQYMEKYPNGWTKK